MNWPAKKTEKLEVRLATETKRAFLARCQSEGRSASEVIRGFIDDHLARPLSQKDLKMIVRSPFTYAGLAAAVAIGGVVVLSAPPSRAEPDLAAIFKALDRNGDGRLSVAEFRRAADTVGYPGPGSNQLSYKLTAGFSEIDINSDASISRAEFTAFNRALETKRFLAFDADSNGSVTLAELQKRDAQSGHSNFDIHIIGSTEDFFRGFDANHDGAITEKEFTSPPGG
jgi:Ca2+-binding EF-hand superfamily protein